jgi:hypothetical protein
MIEIRIPHSAPLANAAVLALGATPASPRKCLLDMASPDHCWDVSNSLDKHTHSAAQAVCFGLCISAGPSEQVLRRIEITREVDGHLVSVLMLLKTFGPQAR